MDKSLMMETAKTVGKCVIRSSALIGTSVAVCGGCLLGTWFYAMKCSNPILKAGVEVLGITGSILAAGAVTKTVDKMLVEDYHLGFDYEKVEE